jgi:FtsH-binding integral membrane protein
VALTAGLLQTEASERISLQLLTGGGSWLLIMVLFMALGWGAQRLAQSPTSVGLQYLGLAIGVIGEALILQPMLWLAYYKSGSAADFQQLVFTAALITGTIFVGLTRRCSSPRRTSRSCAAR